MKEKHLRAYLKCAEAFASCSSSKRLQVGCVIIKNNRIISCGYNALPEHLEGSLEDTQGNTKPEVRHAEKNALIGLTKSNESSVGSSIVLTHNPCKFCAIDIVDAGIVAVYYKDDYRLSDGIEYLKSHNVEVIKL